MAQELKGPNFYSYDLQVETKINIDELIYILTPEDLPLLSGIGSDGLGVIGKAPVDNTVFYWMEEDVPLPRATLAATLTDGSGTSVTVGTGEAVKFAVGDAIRIDDEIMLVTDVNTSTEVLTVTRSALGSAPAGATHAANSEVIGLGTVLPEGDIGNSNFQGRDKYSNYTQIFSKKLTVSRTEQSIPKYGVPNELNKQMRNAMLHCNVGIEQAALYGIKYEDSATRVRSTGGLNSFITSNVDTTSDWITVTAIEALQQDAYDNGGMFEFITARPAAFQALNNIMGNERVQTVTVDDARRGRRRTSVVMTEFGEVTLVRNRYVRKTDAFCYNRDNFVQRVFQPLVAQRLAKTNDTDSFMMVGECGFQVKGQDHMAKFTGLDLAAALPAAGV
jgi:hypothetical protein